jgi:hypothetical protein
MNGQPPQSIGWIAVTARYTPLAWSLAVYRPKLFVDGYEMPTAGWGRTVVPAWPGRRHVHVHVAALMKREGNADAVVDVYPGRLVELEYKAPTFGAFTRGSLGYLPQG